MKMPSAWEPGDLEEASASVVDARQPREGSKPQAAVKRFEESDEVVIPKKPVKTWVTPVEQVEGRAEAKGNLLHETRTRHRAG